MSAFRPLLLAVAAASLPLAGCKTDNAAGDAVSSAGKTVASGGKALASGVASGVGGGIPSLVNVDLSNVLNDLAVRLNLDRANVPINAQIPITLAANICGVSINILSVSTGGKANCSATTSSPELAQVVQQQMAAGGSVGGGAQGGSTAGNGGATGTGATSTSGAGTTAGQSTGSTQTSGQASGTTTPVAAGMTTTTTQSSTTTPK
jgi:predicted small secreted protein